MLHTTEVCCRHLLPVFYVCTRSIHCSGVPPLGLTFPVSLLQRKCHWTRFLSILITCPNPWSLRCFSCPSMGPSTLSSVCSAQHARENLKLGTQCCLHTITGMYPPNGPIRLQIAGFTRPFFTLTTLRPPFCYTCMHKHTYTHTHHMHTYTHVHILPLYSYTSTYSHSHSVLNSVCPVLSWLCPSPSRWTSQLTPMSSKRVM